MNARVEIVDRLNELLEAERAGVELATELTAVASKGYAEGELKKFGEDETWASAGLRRAILKYGGTPSERTGDFARRVLALPTEGERLKLLARGQAWVVKRIEVLLHMRLDPETTGFLTEMREQHLENIDACNRRADELVAPPSPPYRDDLPFARLREAHDQLFYGAWRGPSATVRDLERAHHQLGRYLGMLSTEVRRSRYTEAKTYLAKAMEAYGQVDAEACAEGTLGHLDSALSCCHDALDYLLRHTRVPPHDPLAFEVFYDIRSVPFHDV
ncbi:MAG: hypothetical protein HYY89_00815 [candidate division NC10 bacterium]|nr:hypothetical protein [candidate division NC10 bacterium]